VTRIHAINTKRHDQVMFDLLIKNVLFQSSWLNYYAIIQIIYFQVLGTLSAQSINPKIQSQFFQIRHNADATLIEPYSL